MQKFETLGQYHDFWSVVLVDAPDNFRDIRTNDLLPDQLGALKESFDQLRSGFAFVQKKLKDDRLSKIAQELLEMSFEAYVAGDTMRGAHCLQECEGMIWPKWQLKVKHAVEAERRAFGEIVKYADVVVSPYPYEGTVADLGADQAALLQLAEGFCRPYQRARRDFKYFSWVIDNNGKVNRTSSEPKEDEHPILQPVQKSFGHKRLKELGQTGQIRACVLMQIVGAQGDLGLITYDVEQRDRPRVSARQLFKRENGKLEYEPLRYHLEDPQFFPESHLSAPEKR